MSKALAGWLAKVTIAFPVLKSNTYTSISPSSALYCHTLVFAQSQLLPNRPFCIAYCLLTRPILFLLTSFERLEEHALMDEFDVSLSLL